MHCLVTGGAGFIGSHLTDALIAQGHAVRIVDSLVEQIHPGGTPPEYLNPAAEFIRADVRDRAAMTRALAGIDTLIHLAGAVGVGQSQYQIEHYTGVNATGTATLLDLIVNDKLPVRKIVVAASMSSYGEGLYRCPACGPVRPGDRDEADLRAGIWESRCPHCRGALTPIGMPEDGVQDARSVYALNKKWQEELVLCVGRTYGIPAVALRFFNVFGPRQSLSNPYNGVAAIFISRLKNNQPPVVYEDGNQSRDFIAVSDVARAIIAAATTPGADGLAVNVGSGVPRGIAGIARTLARLMGKEIAPQVTGTFRKGDTRHCFADRTRAMEKLGLRELRDFDDAMRELIAWSAGAEAVDHFAEAAALLARHKLL